MGGGTKDDGLSFYSLQLMLIVSKRYGLVLEFVLVKDRNTIENPLEVAFPNKNSQERP